MPSTLETKHLSSMEAGPSQPPKKKRKGPKGPNPLSVKKKITKPMAGPVKDAGANVSETGMKRVGTDDGNNEDAAGHDDDDAGTSQGGRKRKRRRKSSVDVSRDRND